MAVAPELLPRNAPAGLADRLKDLERTLSTVRRNGTVIGVGAINGGAGGNIQAGSITTSTIAAGSITSTLIAAGTITATNIAAGSITSTEIAAGTITALDIAAGTITATQIATGTITATQIAAGTITASQIAADTITAGNIAANAITTSELNAGAVTAGKIAANTITANEIAASTITAAQIASDTITAGQIAANAITTSELAANAVTAAKITAGTITSNELAANSVTASELAAGSVTAAAIATGSITAALISADTITSAQIAANAITASELSAGAVTATKLNVTMGGGNLMGNSGPDPLSIDTGYQTQSNLTAVRVTSPIRNSPQSYKVTINGGLTADLVVNAGAAAFGHKYRAPTEPGKTYTISCWVRKDATTPGPTNALVRSRFYTDANTLAGAWPTITGPATSIGTTWTRLVATGVAPASTIETGVTFTVAAADAVAGDIFYVTNFQVEEGDVPTSWKPRVDEIPAGTIVANHLTADSVTTTALAADSVTSAKIAANTITAGDIAADTITATEIAANAITTTELAANAVTAAKITAGTITSTQIAADTITAGNLAANSVTASELAANSVTAAAIAANTITAGQIAAATITSTQIAANTITAGNLAAGAVTAASIAAGSITTTELAAGAVTATKISLSSQSDNLVLNGSAEGGLVDGWFIEEATTAAGALTSVPDATSPAAGDNVFQIAAGGGNTGYGHQPIAVRPGATYALRLWVKHSNGTGTHYIRMQQGATYPATGVLGHVTAFAPATVVTERASYTDLVTAGANSGITSWTLKEFAYTVPAGIYWVSPAVYNWTNTTGALTFDGVELREQVTTIQLSDGAVTAQKIAATTITAGNIAADTITAAQIAANAITTSELAAGAVTAAKITAGTITATEIAANTITSTLLQSNTLMGDKLLSSLVLSAGISTSGLAAITANLGVVNAGQINGGFLTIGTSGSFVTKIGTGISTTAGTKQGIVMADSVGNLVFHADPTTGNLLLKGQVQAGSTGLGNFIDTLGAGQVGFATGGQNVLTNSSFDNVNDPLTLITNGASGGTIAKGWQVYHNGATGYEHQLSTGTVRTPGRSMRVKRVSNGGTTAAHVGVRRPLLTGDIARGRPHVLSAWVYNSSASSINVRPTWDFTTGGSSVTIPNVAVAPGTWAQLVLSTTPPAASTGGNIYIFMDTPVNGAEMYVDDVQLQEGDVPTQWAAKPDEILPGTIRGGLDGTNSMIVAGTVVGADLVADTVTTRELNVTGGGGNLVKDSSFEETIAGQINTMTGFQGTVAQAVTPPAGITAIHGTKVASYTATVVARGAFYHGSSSVSAPVTPGQTYVASGYAIGGSAGSADKRVQLRIREYSAAGANLRDITPSVDATDTTTAALSSTAWSRVYGRYTASSDAAYAGLIFWTDRTTGAGAAIGDVFYFDAIMLQEGQQRSGYTPFSTTGGITASQVTAGAITTGSLAALAVTTGKIAAGAVTANEIAADTITAGQIAANAITSSELNALAVTAGKIAANAVTATEIAADTITASQIAANAITSSELAANAVTAGKINALAVTAGTIAANAVTTTELAALAVTAAKIAANTITAGQIAADTITATEIAANAITASELAANSVTAGKINALAVTAGTIAAGAVTTTELGALAVTTAKLAAGAVTANEIGANAVTAGKINALAVTAGTIAAGAVTATELGANSVIAGKINALAVTAGTIATNAVTAGTIAANAVTSTTIATDAVIAGKVAANAITVRELSVTGGSANLLKDSSFEEALAAQQVTPQVFNGSLSRVTIAGAAHGATVLRVTATATGESGFYNGSAAQGWVPVKQGQTYVMSCFLQSSASRATTVYAREMNGAGTFLRDKALTFDGATDTSKPTAPATGWVRAFGRYTPTSDAVFVGFRVGFSASATTDVNYVDAMMISEGDVLAAYTPFNTASGITANQITAGAIQASHINVTQLSAIAADLGTINAGTLNAVTIAGGTITGTTIKTAASGNTRLEMTSTGLKKILADNVTTPVQIGTTNGLDLLAGTAASPPLDRRIRWMEEGTSNTVFEQYIYRANAVSFTGLHGYPRTAATAAGASFQILAEGIGATSGVLLNMNAGDGTATSIVNLSADDSPITLLRGSDGASDFVRFASSSPLGFGKRTVYAGSGSVTWAASLQSNNVTITHNLNNANAVLAGAYLTNAGPSQTYNWTIVSKTANTIVITCRAQTNVLSVTLNFDYTIIG